MKKLNTPSPDELTALHIDAHLSMLWGLFDRLEIDAETLPVFAAGARLAYVRGYHDGDREPSSVGAFDEEDVDLRLVDVWLEITSADVLSEWHHVLLIETLRAAYCRGYLDGSLEKPFGPAPAGRPNSLNLPALAT